MCASGIGGRLNKAQYVAPKTVLGPKKKTTKNSGGDENGNRRKNGKGDVGRTNAILKEDGTKKVLTVAKTATD